MVEELAGIEEGLCYMELVDYYLRKYNPQTQKICRIGSSYKDVVEGTVLPKGDAVSMVE